MNLFKKDILIFYWISKESSYISLRYFNNIIHNYIMNGWTYLINSFNWKNVFFYHIAIFILPALIYTIAGSRLGQGAGFYDNIININISKIYKNYIGLLSKEQVLFYVPLGNFDKTIRIICNFKNGFTYIK